MHSALFLVVVVAATFSLACAQTKCMTPPQWNAGVFVMDFTLQIAYVANFSYDATNQRTRFLEDYTLLTTNTTTLVDVINLYKEGISYRIKYNGTKITKCTSEKLSEPFQPMGIPDGAIYSGTVCQGLIASNGECEGLFVETWKGNMMVGKAAVAYLTSFSRLKSSSDVCIPVSRYLLFYEPKPNEYIHQSYYDVMAKVDARVFDPPSECKQ